MAEKEVINSQEQKAKPPMPEYFRFDERKRQEFLSQVGTFNDEQRGLFNKLCDMWDPECSFSKIAVKIGISNDNNSFKSLMNRLMGAQCGLIKHIFREGQLEVDRVILTDREDVRFYYHLIENELQRCFLSELTAFPNIPDLNQAGFKIPREMVNSCTKEILSTHYSEKHKDDISIIKLDGFSFKGVVVTPRSISDLVNNARFKIRTTLSNTGVLTSVSRLMNLKVSELEHLIKTNDPSHWKKVSSALVDHKEDLLVKHKNIYQGIFPAAEIVLAYSLNELEDSEQQRKEEEIKREKMKQICLRIGKKEDFLLSQKDLNSHLDPETKRWPDFKDQFFENYVKHKARTGLPVIVFTGKDYIHREHVYPLFKQQLEAASVELLDYYTGKMSSMLRGRAKMKNPVFSNRDSFKADIRSQISELYPYLDSMLNKPRIVSEGILYYGKVKLKVKSVDRIKEVLLRYFHEGVIKFKDVDFLLHLYLKDIFTDSFRNLPFLKRLILKLGGRYETLEESFYGLSSKQGHNSETPAGTYSGRGNSGQYSGSSTVTQDRGRRRKTSKTPVQGSRRRRSPQVPPSPRYSKNQIDKAWSEFDEAFAKKKD